MKQQPKKYLVLHASAGNGHTACAQAIVDMLLAQGVREDSITIKDLADINGAAKFIGKDFYLYSMRVPIILHWLYTFTDFSFFPTILSWLLKPAEHAFYEMLEDEQPDFVISTYPMTSNLCARARREGKLNVPFITVATDFFAHYMWVYPETEYYWVMNDTTAQSFMARGVEADRIMVGGIPFHRKFMATNGKDRAVLARLGLPTDRLTILVSSWFATSDYLKNLLQSLAPYADRVACVVVCGRKERTRQALLQQSFDVPVAILGFVDYMPELMDASDMLVGKPGGLTVTESLAKELPLALMQPLIGQERLNAEFLKKKGAAFFLDAPEDIAAIVAEIIAHPVVLERKKRAIAKLSVPESTYNFVRFVLNEAGDTIRVRYAQPVVVKK